MTGEYTYVILTVQERKKVSFIYLLKIKERNDYMMNDKMYIVNKLFNNDTIRAVWDKEEEK